MTTPDQAAWILLFQTFLLSLPAVFLVKRVGDRLGWVDVPGDRKVHLKPVVTAGGVGIYLGLLLSFCLFHLWFGEVLTTRTPSINLVTYKEQSRLWLLFGTSPILLAVGFWDDLRDCNSIVKLGFQILAALVFVCFRVTPGGTWQYETMTLFVILVNTGWIVLLLNAVNLVDGLDGLAAGIVAIASFWLLLANFPMNNQFLTWVGAMLVGSCLAFLVFNFHPASIFMGDTGSLLLGFWVGAGSIEGDFRKISGLVLAAPIVLLGIPILEVVSSALRRLVGGGRVFQADSKHMHHRLLRLGFRHRSIVFFYYGITFLLGMLGFLLAPDRFVGDTPVLRITNPGMAYWLFFIILGSVVLGYTALVAIEKRFEDVIRDLSRKHGAGVNIEGTLRGLVDNGEDGAGKTDARKTGRKKRR